MYYYAIIIGIFVLDIFGGKDTREEGAEDISAHELVLDDGRRAKFTYVYEQRNVVLAVFIFIFYIFYFWGPQALLCWSCW